MRISNGSIELNLTVDGPDDAPPVLMLHGITMSTATWDCVMPALSDAYRVYRLDFRGHGDSDRAPGAYTMGAYVTDAIAAVEDGVGRPCVVVGHSLGGVTAAGLAQQRPELVRAVLLEDPAIFAPPAEPTAGAADALEGNALLEVFTLMHDAIPQLQAAGISVADLAAMLAAGPSPSGPPAGELYFEDTFEAWARSQLKLDAGVLAPIVDASGVDPTEFVAGGFDPAMSITVPGLVLAGDPALPDTVLRQDAIDILATTSPDLRVEIVDGVGHMIHDDRASRAAFTDSLVTLLADHAA